MLLLCLAALLILAYPWLIRPRRPVRDMQPFTGYDYAHRGLWDADRPENSLPAFTAATDAGYGIELDVHLTRDGQLVVHHDFYLDRLCGAHCLIEGSTLQQLQVHRLQGTDLTLPTLAEVLKTVQGRVPLIIELKVRRNAAALAAALDAQMQGYPGAWCVESFHPSALLWFRRHAPQVIRGQLTFDHRGQPGRSLPLRLRDLFVASMLGNALSRPDFIACEACCDRPRHLPMRLLRRMHPHWVGWTIRSHAEMDACRSRYALLIFEGFRPQRP